MSIDPRSRRVSGPGIGAEHESSGRVTSTPSNGAALPEGSMHTRLVEQVHEFALRRVLTGPIGERIVGDDPPKTTLG